MTTPEQAAILAALEQQHVDLCTLVARCERMQSRLPHGTSFWRGVARLAYDGTLLALSLSIDGALLGARAARDHTLEAIAQVRSNV